MNRLFYAYIGAWIVGMITMFYKLEAALLVFIIVAIYDVGHEIIKKMEDMG